MPASVLFDTSLYISALRQGGEYASTVRSRTAGRTLWLSAVVLEELYAGAKTKDRHVIARLEREFARTGRILVPMPSLGDWVETGIVLAQVGLKYGFEQIGRGRLTNVALIALSAARYGCTVLTANVRDFARLAEFRSLRYEAVELR